MADAADRANEHIEESLALNLSKRVRFQGVSQVHCLDCDEEIPEPRRKALPGVELCVYCQQLKEATCR